MKIFKQEVLPTGGLDENHERRVSASPLKYRPEISWDGFSGQPQKSDKKSAASDRKRMRTPDPTMSYKKSDTSLSADRNPVNNAKGIPG